MADEASAFEFYAYDETVQSVVVDMGMGLTKVGSHCQCNQGIYVLFYAQIINVLNGLPSLLFLRLTLIIAHQAGMAGDDMPSAVFPTLVGRPRHVGVCRRCLAVSLSPLPYLLSLTLERLSLTTIGYGRHGPEGRVHWR